MSWKKIGFSQGDRYHRPYGRWDSDAFRKKGGQCHWRAKSKGTAIRPPVAEDGARLCKALRTLQRIWVFILTAIDKGETGRGGKKKKRSDFHCEKYHGG